MDGYRDTSAKEKRERVTVSMMEREIERETDVES